MILASVSEAGAYKMSYQKSPKVIAELCNRIALGFYLTSLIALVRLV